MILLTAAKCLLGESVQIELPRPNMVIDPRVNNERKCKFEFVYHDDSTTVTLTRTDHKVCRGPFQFRVYDPTTESVPDFHSTTYTYMGVEGEKAPRKTTVLIIDPSVKIIREKTFEKCWSIRKCFMHDGVQFIEKDAFSQCSNMKMIRLSRTLRRIGLDAFYACTSLHALFLPSSLEKIEWWAFRRCNNIRILSLPLDIDISQMGRAMIDGCHTFFATTRIQRYQWTSYILTNQNEVHESIIGFYSNQPPLHQACLDTNITALTINNFIRTHGTAGASITDHDGMTPLHILAMNPHADAGTILACFGANMNAAFASDSRYKTPLDYLMEYHDVEVHTSLVAALCLHRDMIKRDREFLCNRVRESRALNLPDFLNCFGSRVLLIDRQKT